METNFPNLEINPVVVGETENHDRIEWVENTLKALFELSWVEETVEDFLKRVHLQKATLDDGTVLYVDTEGRVPIEPVKAFLNDYYDRKWAYLRTPTWDLYGQITIGGMWEMQTEKGIIEMPTVSVNWQKVFFPISAILTAEEKGLYEIYKDFWTAVNQKDSLEKEIMGLLIRLSSLSDWTDIVDSNQFVKEITDFCRWVGTVKKLSLVDWQLNIDFAWRYAKDTDWSGYEFTVLPPCSVFIDIPNHRVRGGRTYHPHILSNRELCMGWVLTDIVNKCMASKSMKWLVEAMVQFWNSYTSSDCWLVNNDRSPSACVFRYLYEWEINQLSDLPVKATDIVKTLLVYYSRPRNDLTVVREYLNDILLAGWDEAIDILTWTVSYKNKNAVLEMINWVVRDTQIREQLYEKYSAYLPTTDND